MKTKQLNRIILLLIVFEAVISCDMISNKNNENSFNNADTIFVGNDNSYNEEEENEFDEERARYFLKLSESTKEGDSVAIDLSKIPKKKNKNSNNSLDYDSQYSNTDTREFHKVGSSIYINVEKYENGVKKTERIKINSTQNKKGYSSTKRYSSEPTWVDKYGNEYTADEIRRLRENDPNHIYQTSGTPVYSEQEMFNRRMDEYLKEKH